MNRRMRTIGNTLRGLPRDFVLFIAAVSLFAFSQSVINTIFNNFLNESFLITDFQRGVLELPRELPGFLVVFFSALFFFLSARRLAALDAAADALGIEVPPTLLAEAVAAEMKELRLHPDQRPRLEEAVRRKLRREIVAQRVAEARGLQPDEDEVKRRAEEQGREESAVWVALVLEKAADWVISQARRHE